MNPTDTVPANNPTPVDPIPDLTPPNTALTNTPNLVDPVPDHNPPYTVTGNPPTDLFQPKASTFSTRALILVHFKIVR